MGRQSVWEPAGKQSRAMDEKRWGPGTEEERFDGGDRYRVGCWVEVKPCDVEKKWGERWGLGPVSAEEYRWKGCCVDACRPGPGAGARGHPRRRWSGEGGCP